MSQNDEGLTVALSPIQLAAVLSQESLSPGDTALNRIWGGTRVLGGLLELLGAGVLCVAPDPTLTTKVGCVIVGAHGTDTLLAGLRQVGSGRQQQGITERGAIAVAERLGAAPSTAATVGLTVDIAVSISGAALAGAVRVASVRAGQISLAAHEASGGGRIGGHTIARHVGKSEAELRARLVANPRIPAASSFTNLNVAESAISTALRANASRINIWSRSASTASKLELDYHLGTAVGKAVLRSTPGMVTLRGVRVVLRLQTFNGMPYYLLTAFPI
jgi:Bacterial CdiA-CT RNAse A domain